MSVKPVAYIGNACAAAFAAVFIAAGCAGSPAPSVSSSVPAESDIADSGAASSDGLAYPGKPGDFRLYNTGAIHSPHAWGSMNVHDPAVLKDGDTYWIYSTDVAVGRSPTRGLQIRKSTDFVNWTWVGTVFDDIPEPAAEWSDAETLWAPDVIKLGNAYYLYYSASVLYSPQSCIGLATAPSPEGPWTDRGILLKSDFSSEVNAIDPAVSFDAEGNLWMVYGSFSEGIYIIEMDKTTGRPVGEEPGRLVATRGSQAGSEAPYIVYNSEFKKYYLFLSYDSLFSDYNVRVGRADSITGPYYDFSGQKLTDYPWSDDVPEDVEIVSANVGNKLIGGYSFTTGEGWVAPGHQSVLNDGGDWYLLHHARPVSDKNWTYLHVRKIFWSADGWPLPSPARYAGEKIQAVPKSSVSGSWEVLCHHRLSYEDPVAESWTFEASGSVTAPGYTGSWKLAGESTLRLELADEDGKTLLIEGTVVPSWDWENGRGGLAFAGIDEDGQTWWAKRVRGSRKAQ